MKFVDVLSHSGSYFLYDQLFSLLLYMIRGYHCCSIVRGLVVKELQVEAVSVGGPPRIGMRFMHVLEFIGAFWIRGEPFRW